MAVPHRYLSDPCPVSISAIGFSRQSTRRFVSGAGAIALLVALRFIGVQPVSAQDAPPPLAQPDMRIYIAAADGSEPKLLTKGLEDYGGQGSPTWSQDGKLIAFDAWRPGKGETYQDAQIVVVNADGTNPRVLCDGAMPEFSPQAKRIVFCRYPPHHGIWVMSTEGPAEELILIAESAWGCDWSPDGKKIVYSDGRDLVVFNLVEGTRQHLFGPNDPRFDSFFWNFAWSPDSKKIVFKGTRDGQYMVAVVNARGAKHGLKTLLEDKVSANFSWHPDGERILFSNYNPDVKQTQLYTLNPDMNGPPQLLSGQTPNWANTAAAYSPDGTKLAIAARRVGR